MSDNWPRFPTDEISLGLLAEACRINETTGSSHLQDFLIMAARVERVTNEETGEQFASLDEAAGAADDEGGPPVFFVEYKEGQEPHSPQTVIISLVEEIERLRGAGREKPA